MPLVLLERFRSVKSEYSYVRENCNYVVIISKCVVIITNMWTQLQLCAFGASKPLYSFVQIHRKLTRTLHPKQTGTK